MPSKKYKTWRERSSTNQNVVWWLLSALVTVELRLAGFGSLNNKNWLIDHTSTVPAGLTEVCVCVWGGLEGCIRQAHAVSVPRRAGEENTLNNQEASQIQLSRVC